MSRGLPDNRAVYLTWKGRCQSIADWCRDKPELKPNTVGLRHRKGWTDGQCLGFEPPPPKPMPISSLTYDGRTRTLPAWKLLTQVDPVSIRLRIAYGWTPGQALGYEPPPGQETGNDVETDGKAEE